MAQRQGCAFKLRALQYNRGGQLKDGKIIKLLVNAWRPEKDVELLLQ